MTACLPPALWFSPGKPVAPSTKQKRRQRGKKQPLFVSFLKADNMYHSGHLVQATPGSGSAYGGRGGGVSSGGGGGWRTTIPRIL